MATLEHNFDAVHRRRETLTVGPNPRPALNYLVTLDGTARLGPKGVEASLRLRYVPDKSLLDPAVFAAYLTFIDQRPWDSLEDVTQTLLGDIVSELIPRWLRLTLRACYPNGQHSVVMEDRRPDWKATNLIAALPLD